MYKKSTDNFKFDKRAVERLRQSLTIIKALFGENLSEVSVFGSYAKGTQKKYSSIDLLIIICSSNDRFLKRNAQVQRTLNEEDECPQIDPLVYTEEEFMDLIQKRESFIDSILRESIVIWNEFDKVDIAGITNENQIASRYRGKAPELEEIDY